MKSLLAFLALLIAFPAFAQSRSKMSPALRNELFGLSYDRAGALRLGVSDPEPQYYPLIIKLKDTDADLPDFVRVIHRRGSLLLVYVPIDKLPDLSQLGAIARIEGGSLNAPRMDLARGFCGYPEIASGSSFPLIYTGKGVVTGLVDTGIDLNHIAFRDPAGGQSRIARFSYYGPSPDDVFIVDIPSEIAEWATDNDREWHGTHVAGILSGSFIGNPYYGIAREADIVAATSFELYSPLLLAGMEEIIDYAKTAGKPAVINMSIGSNTGPHDGTSLFSQYLDLLSEDAILCLSAGNEGNRKNRYTGAFPSDGASAGIACISASSWVSDNVLGQLDIWGRDSRSFGLNILLQTEGVYTIAHRIPVPPFSAAEPSEFVIATSQEILGNLGNPPGVVSPELASAVTGYIAVAAELNPDNNRFNASVSFNITAHNGTDGKPEVLINPGVEAVGSQGQTLDFYASESLRTLNIKPHPEGFQLTEDGSISDLCSGENVICVGAMASRPSVQMLNDQTISVDDPVGAIAYFSSFSSGDGMRPMPDIVAPGEHTVSAISSPFLTAHPEYKGSCIFSQQVDNREYYWAADRGTSMSSPFVAGVIALWLQADPTLTTPDVKQILSETALTPTVDPTSPRWGGGVLNASDGLRRVLDRAGIPSISTDSPTPVIHPLPSGSPSSPRLEISSPAPATLELYTLSGALLLSTPLPASPTTISLPSVSPGLYLLRLTSPSFPPLSLKLPL